jgi:hypothetical protein
MDLRGQFRDRQIVFHMSVEILDTECILSWPVCGRAELGKSPCSGITATDLASYRNLKRRDTKHRYMGRTWLYRHEGISPGAVRTAHECISILEIRISLHYYTANIQIVGGDRDKKEIKGTVD